MRCVTFLCIPVLCVGVRKHETSCTLLNLQRAATKQLPRARKPNHTQSNIKTQTHTHRTRAIIRTVCAAIQQICLFFQGVPKATNCLLSHKWVSLPHEEYHSSNSNREGATSLRLCIYVQQWLYTICALSDSCQQLKAIYLFIYSMCAVYIPSICKPQWTDQLAASWTDESHKCRLLRDLLPIWPLWV